MTDTTIHIRPLPGPLEEWSSGMAAFETATPKFEALEPLYRWTPVMSLGHVTGWSRRFRWTTTGTSKHGLDPLVEENDALLGAEGLEEDDSVQIRSSRELALSAVDSLRRWLSLTDEQVAELAAVAPRTIPNWRNRGQQPYPATVRRLFEINNLVAALVRRLGLREAAIWLSQPLDDVPRLDLIRRGEIDQVLADAARILFPVPRRRVVDEAEDEEPRPPRRQPEIFRGRATSARRRNQS